LTERLVPKTELKTRTPNGGDKTESLSTRLRQLALKRGPDAKLPTVDEICDLFGTNRVSLSVALQELEARNVIYRRRGSGIYVSPQLYRKTIMILLDAGIFLSAYASPFWGMLWGLLAKEAQRRAAFREEECHFHIVSSEPIKDAPLPLAVADAIESGFVDGALAVVNSSEIISWIDERDIPVVSYAGTARWRVRTPPDELIRMGVASLADAGCSAIGLWSSAPRYIGMDPEEEAGRAGMILDVFQSALADRGLPLCPEFVMDYRLIAASEGEPTSLSGQEQGYESALKLFGAPGGARPDSLLIMDDMMADGAIAGMEKLGMKIGEDIKIATQANVGSTALFGHKDRLILMEHDPAEIARAMFELLDDAMSGASQPESVVFVTPKVRLPQQ
jgi:DNA-binding LacI/PurR family transcriptional regulator